MNTSIETFEYNSERGTWQDFHSSKDMKGSLKGYEARVATLNVLADCFPWFIELAIDSKMRFPAMIEELIKLDPTFCGLNEVTESCLGLLLAHPYIQENYYISNVTRELKSERKTDYMYNPHGCLLLSKVPFLSATAIGFVQSERDRPAIIGLFRLSLEDADYTALLAVCSIHTLAYQSPANKRIREKQLLRAADQCRLLLDDNEIESDIRTGFIMMGDMNLHYISEDGVVGKCETVDAYAETHFASDQDNNDGYTFDAKGNSMIKRYIPGEKRKMRLDRILVSQGSPFYFVSPCEMWANEAVDVRREIYISDHYGLFVDIQLDKDADLRENSEVAAKLMKNSQMPLEIFEFSKLDFAVKLVPHSFWLLSRAFGLN